MLKHDLSDATAADLLARNVQETDANLHLDTAPAAGVASHENPARVDGLRQALLGGFPPETLHEQIVADSVLADLEPEALPRLGRRARLRADPRPVGPDLGGQGCGFRAMPISVLISNRSRFRTYADHHSKVMPIAVPI
ncbi:hypothetical protein [uncultured Paludibaculum sp.]|uniref:hypothetical protein n=1 Tax=uncultured Paludibaculum sp. TaxID=1765020 RepID=UPI002AAB3DEC|nr:hypothetical protein [uncultured Paludibaculum sp.]